MKLFQVFIGIVAICIFSCNNKEKLKSCIPKKYNQLKIINGNLLKSKSDSTTYLYDIGEDNRRGIYTFYKNGNLKEYLFFQNENNYSYSEKYEDNGNLDSVVGKPILWMPFSEIGQDSLKIDLDIFDLNKDLLLFQIRVNDSVYNGIKFWQDTSFSNMKRMSILLNSKNKKKIKIYYFSKFKFCDNSERVFEDSIYFNRE